MTFDFSILTLFIGVVALVLLGVISDARKEIIKEIRKGRSDEGL